MKDLISQHISKSFIKPVLTFAANGADGHMPDVRNVQFFTTGILWVTVKDPPIIFSNSSESHQTSKLRSNVGSENITLAFVANLFRINDEFARKTKRTIFHH